MPILCIPLSYPFFAKLHTQWYYITIVKAGIQIDMACFRVQGVNKRQFEGYAVKSQKKRLTQTALYEDIKTNKQINTQTYKECHFSQILNHL